MRPLEKRLVTRGAVALACTLVVSVLAQIGMQYAILVAICNDLGLPSDKLNLLPRILMMSGVLILAVAGLALWIGRIVSRYVSDRDRLRVAKDMQLAADIQLGSMPRTFPAFPDQTAFDIYAMINPSKKIGGDFYDFYLARPNRFIFLIADVSGGGVPSALFMMRAQTLLKGLVMTGIPLAEAVRKANDTLCEENAAGFFASVWIGDLDSATGRVTYVNAGHNPPIRRRADRRTAEYVKDDPSLILGAIAGVPYESHELQLVPGESLFLYTSGITEQVDSQNEPFGEDRLLSCVRDTTLGRRDLMDRVAEAVLRHAGTVGQFDDCTQLELVWRGKRVGDG